MLSGFERGVCEHAFYDVRFMICVRRRYTRRTETRARVQSHTASTQQSRGHRRANSGQLTAGALAQRVR